jgi:amino acid permease
MKKILGILSGIFLTLVLALPAYAQIPDFHTWNYMDEPGYREGVRLFQMLTQIVMLLTSLGVLISLSFLIYGIYGIFRRAKAGKDDTKRKAAKKIIVRASKGFIIVILVFFLISIIAYAYGIPITLPIPGYKIVSW